MGLKIHMDVGRRGLGSKRSDQADGPADGKKRIFSTAVQPPIPRRWMNLPTPRIEDADGYAELCCCRRTQLPSFPSGIRRGKHMALLEQGTKGGAAPLLHSLIVSAKLTDGMRPARLTLCPGPSA